MINENNKAKLLYGTVPKVSHSVDFHRIKRKSSSGTQREGKGKKRGKGQMIKNELMVNLSMNMTIHRHTFVKN